MKKIKPLLAILLAPIFSVYAQEATDEPGVTDSGVEKSIINVQTGILGVWASYEAGLSNTLALRAEAGLDAGFYYTYATRKTVFMAGPSVNIEPRWYYNINKRAAKDRNTSNNGANFLALSVRYLPDWFTLSNEKNYNIADQLFIVPKWSIRRNIGNSNFNYEAGIGLGYQHVFLKQYGYTEDDSKAYLDLHVRLGYTF